MSFASIHFIFFFLPIVLLFFFILPKGGWRNAVLVFSSLAFFAWEDPAHLPILVLSLVMNYSFGLVIDHLQTGRKTQWGRVTTWIAIGLNLLSLVFYKYLGFFSEMIQAVSRLQVNVKELSLPLGISYFTFSGISYIVDIYRKIEKPERNILRFSAFLIMFPKLIQGPITRYKDVKNELMSFHFVAEDVQWGIRRFITGLAKKVLLANSLATTSNKVFETDLTRLGADVAWFGLIAYSLVLYFDFSGYTDMALGLGRIFGLRLPENFNYPYASLSVADFWRRWHMTLITWFRTYVFFPLEYARRRHKFLRQPTDILIVFLLTGLWHGASWNFIIWGGYFGLILAVEAGSFGYTLKKAPRFLQSLYTLVLVMFGWIFFRLVNLTSWGLFFSALFGGNGWTHLETMRSLKIVSDVPIVGVAILFSLPIYKKYEAYFISGSGAKRIFADVVFIGIFLVSIAYILSNGFQSFMYTQF